MYLKVCEGLVGVHPSSLLFLYGSKPPAHICAICEPTAIYTHPDDREINEYMHACTEDEEEEEKHAFPASDLFPPASQLVM